MILVIFVYDVYVNKQNLNLASNKRIKACYDEEGEATANCWVKCFKSDSFYPRQIFVKWFFVKPNVYTMSLS